LTSGGYEFHISEEFDGRYYGRAKRANNWDLESWDLDGNS